MHFLFDIGGTNMRLAVTKDGESIEKSTTVPTPQSFDEAIALIEKNLPDLVGQEAIIGAAGGVAGNLDAGKSWLFYSPNLRDWEKKPLKQTLESKLKCPVVLENDAAAAGLGEALVKTVKDYKIVAYMTVGTGVGGARIVDGKIDQRLSGFEPGHQIIDISEDGKIVELETLVSGAGIKKQTGKNPNEISDSLFWDKVAKNLAIGLNNTILHWSPQIVLLGGSLITEGIIPLTKVNEHLNSIFTAFPDVPPLQTATLKDQSALFGAMQLLKGV